MNQASRILQKLRARGKTGVMNYEFVHMMPPILRYSARIDELRKEGHDIQTKRIKKGIFKFILHVPEPIIDEDINNIQEALF